MKICAYGECLIDFTPYGISDKGNVTLEQNPGGAPANLAVAIAKQNGESSFLGKVGQDKFGNYLINILMEAGVDTQYIIQSDRYHTTLAFVHLTENGERDFTFYRNPGADVMIESREINFNALDECDIFHFGSLSLTHNPARTTTYEILKYVKNAGKIITYDPNLRMPLWSSVEEAKAQIKKGLDFCDILKVTEEELEFITGITDIKEAMLKLQEEFNISIMLCTRAEKGCICYGNGHWLDVPTFKVNTIDSTGAGDAFFGSFLASLTNKDYKNLNENELREMIIRANASGALATTIKGAIPSLPTLEQVNQFLQEATSEN